MSLVRVEVYGISQPFPYPLVSIFIWMDRWIALPCNSLTSHSLQHLFLVMPVYSERQMSQTQGQGTKRKAGHTLTDQNDTVRNRDWV